MVADKAGISINIGQAKLLLIKIVNYMKYMKLVKNFIKIISIQLMVKAKEYLLKEE